MDATKAPPLPYSLPPRRRLRPSDSGRRPVVGDKTRGCSFRLFLPLQIKDCNILKHQDPNAGGTRGDSPSAAAEKWGNCPKISQ